MLGLVLEISLASKQVSNLGGDKMTAHLKLGLVTLLIWGSLVQFETPSCYGQGSGNRAHDALFLRALEEPDSANAIELWRGILKRNVKFRPTALVLLAKRYNDIGDYQEANSILSAREIKECGLCIGNARVETARALMGLRDYDQAVRELKSALPNLNSGGRAKAYDRRDVDVHEFLSWANFGRHHFEEAIQEVDHAISSGPEGSRVRLSRSAMLICLGKGSLAGNDALYYLSAAKETDEDLESLVILGYFGFLQENKKSEAAELLRDANAKFNVPKIAFPYLGYLSGNVSASLLYRCAAGDASKTDLQCYLAMEVLSSGSSSDARKYLEWVMTNGMRDRPTYHIATAIASSWPNPSGKFDGKIRPAAELFLRGRPSR